MFPILKSKRLTLREILVTDLNRMFAILSREDVTRFYGLEAVKNSSEVMELIHYFNEMFTTKKGIRWGIIENETNLLIGTCGFNSYNERNKRAEIGYELHPDYWNKGFASEAISSVLTYGFDALHLNRIAAIVYPENIPSQKLLRNLGFIEEGLLRDYLIQGDQYHSTIVFSILQNEWVRIRKQNR